MLSSTLGKMMISANLITEDQLQKALLSQQKEGGRLGSILVKLGFIAEDRLIHFLSQQYGVPSINLSSVQIDPSVVKLVPPEVVQSIWLCLSVDQDR